MPKKKSAQVPAPEPADVLEPVGHGVLETASKDHGVKPFVEDPLLPSVRLDESVLQAISGMSGKRDYCALLDAYMKASPDTAIQQAELVLFNENSADSFYRYTLQAVWTKEKGASPASPGTHLPFATFFNSFETKKALFSQNIDTDENLDQDTRKVLNFQGESLSVGVIPLHSGITQVGVLLLKSSSVNSFTAAEMIVFPALASQLALSIQNARLADQAASSFAEVELLHTAGSALACTQEYAEVLEVLRQHTILGRDAVHLELCLFDEPVTGTSAPTGISAVAIWDADKEVPPILRRKAGDFPMFQKIFNSETTGILEAPKSSLDPGSEAVQQFFAHYNAARAIFLPLNAAGNWIGTAWSAQSSTQSVSEDERRLSMLLARQAALAVQCLDCQRTARQSNFEAGVLSQASQQLSMAGSESEIFRITLQAAFQAVPAQTVYIHTALIDQGKPSMRQAGALAAEGVPLQKDGNIFPGRLFPFYEQFMAGLCVLSENTRTDERLSDTARRFFQITRAVSVLAVPVPVRGQTYGVLLAARSQTGIFSPSEVTFLQSLCAQAGIALENLRLLMETRATAREAHERTLELSLINRVVSSVTAASDLKAGLQSVIDELVESFSLASGGIALLNDEKTSLQLVVERSREGQPTSLVEIPVKGNPSTQRLLETKKPLVVLDAQHSPLTAPIHTLMAHRKIQTLVLLPLIINDEVIGSVGMDIQEPDRVLTADEIHLAETIIFQAAVAIQNSRLFDKTRRALEETELLYRISRGVAEAATTADLANLVFEKALPQHAEQITFLFTQPVLAGEARELEIAGRRSRASAFSSDGTRFAESDLPILSQVGDMPFLIQDYKSADLDARSIETLIRLEFVSGCILSLKTAGQQIGYLLVSSSQPISFTSEELRSLQITADGIAVALEKQRLLGQAQRRAVELQTAALVARETSGTLDLDILLKRMVDLLCERFGFYHASVFLVDEDREFAVVRESTGLAGEEMKARGHKLAIGSRSIIGSVTASGQPLVVNDVSRSATHRKNPLLPNTRAELGIPLKLGDRIIGALDVQSTQVNAFHPDDVAVLQILADQIAVAIENARAYTISLEAVEEMREADKMKSKFLANMSHELRTPLNSIIGFSRVILKGIDGPVTDIQQQDLTAIYNSGQHLLRLINDLLDLSKIEAGKMEISFGDVNIAELVNSIMSTTTGLIKDKQLKIIRSIPADLPPIRGDSVRLRQVLLNLVSNAAKFTDHGSITIDASQQSGPHGQPEVIIRVSDTGQGISPEHQRKLFQPFSQVDDSPTRKTGGTGLGLSISKSLVDMHGGRIGLEKSRLGEGSTFYFTVPVSANVPTAVAPGAPSQAVLAIDPDSRAIRLYQNYLEPKGYQVIPIAEPSIAGYHAQRLKPLAAILDVTPRDHSGWKAVRQMRADPETANLTMILCSLVHEEEAGFCLGITEFLNKPLQAEVLSAALSRLGLNSKFRELLIVDDYTEDLKVIQQAFEEQTNTFLTFAKDAWQARALLTKRKPSAVIIDLIKPDLYRLDLLKELRTNPEFTATPLVFLMGVDRLQENIDQLDQLNQELLARLVSKPDVILASLEKILSGLKPAAKVPQSS